VHQFAVAVDAPDFRAMHTEPNADSRNKRLRRRSPVSESAANLQQKLSL